MFCTVSLINSKAKLASEGEKKIKKSLKFEHQTVHIRWIAKNSKSFALFCLFVFFLLSFP